MLPQPGGERLVGLVRIGTGLGKRFDHYPSQLSGGQQQRVAIARALVNEPQVLLADEPTGNLDSKTSVEVMGVFQKLNDQGTTILMVTHELDIASYCKRNLILRDGVIVSDVQVNPRLMAPEELKKLADAGVTDPAPLISRQGGALQLLSGTPGANEAAALVTPFLRRDSSCQALVAVLPADARFTGYTYEASDAFGSGACAAGEECAIGACSWIGEPTEVHTAGPTLVYGVFKNASQGRERLAKLTVYFAPGS